jgi:hypothetical protein
LGIALAVTATAVTGCSTDDGPSSSDGSLELSTSPGEWCLDTLGDSTEYTFGAEQISNKGDKIAAVTELELENVSGLEVVGAYVSPLKRGSLGVFSGWQGADRKLDPLEKVEPGSTSWLTLRLRVLPDAGERASFDSIGITYDEGGASHEVRSTVGFVATSARC